MNRLTFLVVIIAIFIIADATPITTITDKELYDEKYLCEDNSALRPSDYNNVLQFKGDVRSSSDFFNKFYNIFMHNFKSIMNSKQNGKFPFANSRFLLKRNLDSIGGGQLIKRNEDSD